MATHSSFLAWEITEELGGILSRGGHKELDMAE